MRDFKRYIFFIFVALFIIIAGCSSKEVDSNGNKEAEQKNVDKSDQKTEETVKQGGEMRIAINAQPPNLDPPTNASTATRDTSRLIYETLLTTDSNYKVVPMLADTFETDDNKTFVFHLRQGVTFHNGKEMIAEDIIASMERWLEKSPITGSVFEGATWEAEDDHTVVLELLASSALALDTMATSKHFAAVMPKEIIDEAAVEGVNDYFGTGPYQFEEWKQDQYIHFTKYEDYQALDMEADGLAGKKEALIDDIYFDIVTDASTRVAGLQTGEYDFAYVISYDNYDLIENDPDLNTHLMPSGAMALHYNKSGGPTANVDLRKAINTGVDLEALMLSSFPNTEFYTVHSSYMEEEIANWASSEGSEYHNLNDPEKAKELLDEYGYNGEEIRILASRDYDHHYSMGVVLEEQLNSIGINTKLEVYDWPTTIDMITKGEGFEIFVVSLSTVSTPPQFLSISPSWAGGVQSEKVDADMKALETAGTLEEAQNIWNDLQLYLWEEHLPATVAGSYNDLFGSNKRVEGITTFSGPIFWNATIVE